MNPQLRESELPAAFEEFVARCGQQFQDLGFDITSTSGAFELKLKDEPPLDTADSEAYNGRFWLNNPKFASTNKWPCCNSHGVYLFFDEEYTARYVGKAENYIGSRLGSPHGRPWTESRLSPEGL